MKLSEISDLSIVYSETKLSKRSCFHFRANNAEFSQNTEIMEENGVIRFNGVSGPEAGGYICTATNAVGTVTATATLTIAGGM